MIDLPQRAGPARRSPRHLVRSDRTATASPSRTTAASASPPRAGERGIRIQLPIAQMYHVTVDNRVPYYVYGNKQDGESAMGPSNSKQAFFGRDGGIWRGEWRSVGGGESGWATPDTVDSNLVWSSASGSGAVGGIVDALRRAHGHHPRTWRCGRSRRERHAGGQREVPLHVDLPAHDLAARSQHGVRRQPVVHATTDGGQSWNVISPDLTRNDKSKQRISGGLTPDNIGVEYADVVFAIAESPLAKGELWVGTNDGLVQLTRDGGKTLDERHGEHSRACSHVGDGERASSRRATPRHGVHDGGRPPGEQPRSVGLQDDGLREEWTLIVKGIAKSPLSYAHVIREDPARKGLLYLGTENGLYVSFDDGGELAAAAEQPAARAGVLDHGAAALPRSRGGDVRPRLLHPR